MSRQARGGSRFLHGPRWVRGAGREVAERVGKDREVGATRRNERHHGERHGCSFLLSMTCCRARGQVTRRAGVGNRSRRRQHRMSRPTISLSTAASVLSVVCCCASSPVGGKVFSENARCPAASQSLPSFRSTSPRSPANRSFLEGAEPPCSRRGPCLSPFTNAVCVIDQRTHAWRWAGLLAPTRGLALPTVERFLELSPGFLPLRRVAAGREGLEREREVLGRVMRLAELHLDDAQVARNVVALLQRPRGLEGVVGPPRSPFAYAASA